jgi:transcriptional regulator with XRE-family HTH domain
VVKRKTQAQKLNLLKEILAKQGKTQSWLAGELDMEFRSVSRYVNNHRQPSLDKLFEIARILKVNVKDLINS